MAELARMVGRDVCGEDLLSLSVGYAIYPDEGLDSEKLLAEADHRLYLVKQKHHKGRNSFASQSETPGAHGSVAR